MTKDELLAKIQSTVDEQQAKLEELKNRAVDESEEAVEDIRAAIAKLEPQLEQAKQKALELADIADDKWDEFKDSFEESWDGLVANLGDELSHVGDAIQKGIHDAQAKAPQVAQGLLGKIKALFS